jgi:tetratricopeptide (TPR) repeat protein
MNAPTEPTPATLPIQEAIRLAQQEIHAGKFADAIARLAPLEAGDPQDAALEEPLGQALIKAGNLGDGVVRLEWAASQRASAEAYLTAGQARFAMNQVDLARADAEAAARLNSTLAGLSTLMGMILEQTSDYDGAEKELLLAVSSSPNDFNAHFYLGAIYYFKRDTARAAAQLTRALELQPTAAQARYELALVERADGKPLQALRQLEIVVKQMPDWLQPHVELSALYFRLHRAEDGAKEKAIVDKMMAALQQQQSQAAH